MANCISNQTLRPFTALFSKERRTVVVRINDRGPFAKNRIIDLSKAAAKELGMIAAGVARVEVSPAEHALASN